jgi:polysaccharide transporter, PST family
VLLTSAGARDHERATVSADEALITTGTPPPEAHDGAEHGAALSRVELSRRVARSVLATSTLGIASLAIGFFGNLVLAHLLHPREFGIVAIGATVVLVAGAFGDAGLGAGMLRWPDSPTRTELSDLVGVQLILGGSLAVVVGAVAAQFGSSGLVVAVMLLAVPVTAFQTPGRVLFMRGVRFERLSIVDGIANIGFYVWAIATVAAGLGVWGLATATIARAMIGTVLIWIVGEPGIVHPTLHHPGRLRPLAGFGLRFQGSYGIFVLREIVVNLLTASIAGVQALGLWSLARRLIEVPYVMVGSLERVVFPAMTHIMRGGGDPAPVVERSARVVSVIAAIGTATFAGLVPPLIPEVFGGEWTEVGEIVPWATAAVLFLAGAGVVAAGYLMAADRTQDTLRAVFAGAVVWIAVTAGLLPVFGVVGVGMAMFAGLVVESGLYVHATHRSCGARVARHVSPTVLVGAAGIAVGGILGVELEPSVAAGFLAGTAALATTLVGLLAFCRPALFDAIAQTRANVRRIVPQSAQ